MGHQKGQVVQHSKNLAIFFLKFTINSCAIVKIMSSLFRVVLVVELNSKNGSR